MADITELLKATEGVVEQYEPAPPIPEGFFSELAGGAIESIRTGAADLPLVLQKVADVGVTIAKDYGVDVPKTEMFKRLAEAIDAKDVQDQATLARKIGRAVGGVITALPKYAPLTLAGPYAAVPLFAGMGAATAWGRDASEEEIAKQAVMEGTFGAMLGGAGKLARWPRAGALATGSTALEVAATGGQSPVEDYAVTGLTMGTLGVMGGKYPHGLQSKLNKLGYPNEVIKKMTIKQARQTAKNGQKYVAPEPVVEVDPNAVGSFTFQGMRDLVARGRQERAEAIHREATDPQALIYNRILSARGFSDEQIAAMDYVTKLALANSEHTAESMHVDPIYGRLTPTGKPPKAPAPESPAGKVKTPGFAVKPEDIILDPKKEAELLAATDKVIEQYTAKDVGDALDGMTNSQLVDVAKKYGIEPKKRSRKQLIEEIKAKAIVEEEAPAEVTVETLDAELKTRLARLSALKIDASDKDAYLETTKKLGAVKKEIDTLKLGEKYKEEAPVEEKKETRGRKWPTLNKETVAQIKQIFHRDKYNFEENDIKKVARMLESREIRGAEAISAFFKKFPVFPGGKAAKGKTLFDFIKKYEKEPRADEIATEKQLATETTKFQMRKGDKFESPMEEFNRRMAFIKEELRLVDERLAELEKPKKAGKAATEYKGIPVYGKEGEEPTPKPGTHKKPGTTGIQYKVGDIHIIEPPANATPEQIMKYHEQWSRLLPDKPITEKDILGAAFHSEADALAGIAAVKNPSGVLKPRLAWKDKESPTEIWRVYKEEPSKPAPTKATKLRKKTGVEKLLDKVAKGEEEIPKKLTPEEMEHAGYMEKALKLWPRRITDLGRLAIKDLKYIADNNITPEKASITPEGRLVLVKPGDKATGAATGISAGDAAVIREATKPETAGIDEVMLRKAAAALELSDRVLAGASDLEKQSIIDTYLKLADEKVPKVVKTEELLEKSEIAATKTFNQILAQDTKTDPELLKLQQKFELSKRNEKIAQERFASGEMDKVDLDVLIAAKDEALKAVEKRRNEVKANQKKAAATSGVEHVISIEKEDNGAAIIRKKIDNNYDEFYLITKDGKLPVAGDAKLAFAGKARVLASGKNPVIKEFPEKINMPQGEFFKSEFEKAIQQYYEKQGKGMSKGPSTVKLTTGIDVDAIADMVSKIKQKTISIYQGFAARKGANKSIPKEDIPSVMRDMMEGESLKLTEAEISAMHAELMTEGRSVIPEGWPIPGGAGRASAQPTMPLATPSTAIPVVPGFAQQGQAVEAPPAAAGIQPVGAAIPKGGVPLIRPTDVLGQPSMAHNPDIRLLTERTILNEIRKSKYKELLVYGENSRLEKIFEKINKQPNAQLLREELSDSFIRKTTPTNPLLLEAKNDIRSFLDSFGDAHELRKRGFFIDEFFPLIPDMDGTYIKVHGMFENIHNNRPYDKVTNPKGIPDRYVVAGKSMLSEEEFIELKTIFSRKKEWNALNNYEKNKIRYNVLQFEGIYDKWAFLPPEVMDQLRPNTFNPHLKARKGGALLSYKHDAQEVLKQYIYTMINKESDRILKQEVRPILDKYPRGDTPFTVRWYMDKQVKQALGTRTQGARFISQLVEKTNDLIGREVIDPNFPNIVAARTVAQTARGALGPDTALRNITQSFQTLVNEGPGPFARGLYSYLTGKGVTPEAREMFRMFFPEAETFEGSPQGRTLGSRLARAESWPSKALAFYDWVGDMALSPMRATEHFNKFLAFQTALNEAGKKGLSFEKGVRLGLLSAMKDVPDITIPDAYWNAFKHTIQSQYGYGKVMRNPLTRGPLAKMSTIFWSYPANTAQFISRGLVDSIKGGDYWRATRFGLYIGFQLSIASAMAKLGIDVASIFGVGLLPVKMFSVPWDMMKGAYNGTFGDTAGSRSKGWEDFFNALGILTIPQFRYGKKILNTATNLEDGYKAAGKRQQMVMEMSPYAAIMDLTGFPFVGTRETYDLVASTYDRAGVYNEDKQALVLKGIKALDKGKAEDVRKMFDEAKKKNVVITYADLIKHYRIHKTKTYLQSALERLPRHLRPEMQKKIDELERRWLPSKFGLAPKLADKSMWSRTNDWGKEIEEEE